VTDKRATHLLICFACPSQMPPHPSYYLHQLYNRYWLELSSPWDRQHLILVWSSGSTALIASFRTFANLSLRSSVSGSIPASPSLRTGQERATLFWPFFFTRFCALHDVFIGYEETRRRPQNRQGTEMVSLKWHRHEQYLSGLWCTLLQTITSLMPDKPA
jgi:hypothetical protein